MARSACLAVGVQSFLGLRWMLVQQMDSALQEEQNAVKALQQRVVQIAGDTGTLADALLQSHIELLRQLPQPQLIECPQQCQESEDAR